MNADRFTSLTYTLHPQPVPGQREIRFRPAKNMMLHRPREVREHV